MSMKHSDFLVRASIEAEVLEAWMAAGWVTPSAQAGVRQFSAIDVARVRLIQDLRGDIGVNDEGVSIILDLIDQLHGLRRALGQLLTALRTQPEDLRERLAIDLQHVMATWGSLPDPEQPPGKVRLHGGRHS
jgi:chaperone modulatory protein CbpM